MEGARAPAGREGTGGENTHRTRTAAADSSLHKGTFPADRHGTNPELDLESKLISSRASVVSAIVIAGGVPSEIVSGIRSAIAAGPFISGKVTAVGRAVTIKDNLILAPDAPATARASDLLVGALQANPFFQAATWPEAMRQPFFCRYEVGMKYGDHVDGALMGDAPSQIRCDIAMTVCLSDGVEYEGGELVMDTAGVPTAWKGQAGDVIVYPADTVHRVAQVTRGVRDVAISWIQSMVREPGRRRILFDLKSALDGLDQSAEPPPLVEALRRSYFNLIRMWA